MYYIFIIYVLYMLYGPSFSLDHFLAWFLDSVLINQKTIFDTMILV